MNKTAFDKDAIGQKGTCLNMVQNCDAGYRVIHYVFGKVKAIKKPGAFIVVPFISEVRPVFCGLTSADISPEDVNTKDGFSIKVDASIQYKVIDPNKAAHNIINLHQMLKDNVTTAIRQTFCDLNLEEILSKQTKLPQLIRIQLNAQYAHLQKGLIQKEYDEELESVESIKSEKEGELISIESNHNNQKDDNNNGIDEQLIVKYKQVDNKNAKKYLEEYIGIKIGNINLERVHFPKKFTETKTKIQQYEYEQLQLNVKNKTGLLKEENEQKLIKINAESQALKILRLAEARKKEKIINAEAVQKEKIINAEAEANELKILNDAIKKYPEGYKLNVLKLSSEAWKYVAGSKGSKLIMTNENNKTKEPFNFINQLSVVNEVLNDKK